VLQRIAKIAGMWLAVKNDALANSNCHPRMLLSGIYDFNRLQTGFPLRIAAGMTLLIAPYSERFIIQTHVIKTT
jgi:hypothetical protein